MKKVFAFLLTLATVFSVCSIMASAGINIPDMSDRYEDFLRIEVKSNLKYNNGFYFDFWKNVAQELRAADAGSTLSVIIPANIDQTRIPTFLFDALAYKDTVLMVDFERKHHLLPATNEDTVWSPGFVSYVYDRTVVASVDIRPRPIDASMKPNIPSAISYVSLISLNIGYIIPPIPSENPYFDILKESEVPQ